MPASETIQAQLWLYLALHPDIKFVFSNNDTVISLNFLKYYFLNFIKHQLTIKTTLLEVLTISTNHIRRTNCDNL